ncbi:hypothetical protein, partial [Mesorhizobium sp.]|uniref:hypothetical protein n=1 Tax=Mesorhizobium sp. TaxID=1871066 RepID=UPI0025CCB17A
MHGSQHGVPVAGVGDAPERHADDQGQPVRLDEADAGAGCVVEQHGFSPALEERAGNVGGEPACGSKDQEAGIHANEKISKEGCHDRSFPFWVIKVATAALAAVAAG